ncbi:3',5'-cyclic adenosine monophosphate phosphodiesterase CpdA [Candidatus Lokiarchaeum ossiferum]|uniref:3',5'-cyclic adenosine monophosphate phosphodiesterase CpdA n=1 Tax=Candidatus Lokiarchaeum ossiferum TaxID=2951803 RepID=A0ABY6HTX7_9ARCH|nr:3',5'-cyclic adenosine monophosphate phosphodiesterase CpdA [Candidatus Lokiarchaeum sp. B-35]
MNSSQNISTNTKSTRFLHASDLHFGSKQYQNPLLADDHLFAFQQILTLAIDRQVDFIILGGDIFTSQDLLPNQMEQIIDILSDFKQRTNEKIPIIAIEGNHDIRRYSHGNQIPRRQSWLRILNKLGMLILLDADLENQPEQRFSIFDPILRKGGKVIIKNCVIYGSSYLGKQLPKKIHLIREGINDQDGMFHILLQHFGIQGQMKGVPGQSLHRVSCLRDRVDYLGLGHYHLGYSLQGWIFNPGCAQAVSAGENTFQKGVFYGEISGSKGIFRQKISLIKLKNRPIEWITVFFSKSYQSMSEIYAQINHEIIRQNPFLIQKNDQILKNSRSLPVLYIVFKGNPPSRLIDFEDKPLREWFLSHLDIIDVKIYRKFIKSTRTLETYASQQTYKKPQRLEQYMIKNR